MNTKKAWGCALLIAAIIFVSLWGCAGAKPFDPPQSDEIPKGPGVFSKGDDGVVLYDSNKKSDKTAVSAETQGDVPAGAAAQPPGASDYEEFEAYRKWLQWKKSAEGTPEYEEFQQWRQWQQYQQWKKDK